MFAFQQVDAGSFRDPKGHIYHHNGRIYRTVTEFGLTDFNYVLESGLFNNLVNNKKLVPFEIVKSTHDPETKSSMILEHPVLPFISYPYEWSFSLLKEAAKLQLEILLEALSNNVILSDASAFNIQFHGTTPIFIDHLSFRPYQPGEYWTAHRQFCDQFLNPLLLRSKLGVHHNHWYRGSMEGISTPDLNRLLPLPKKIDWNTFSHVYLQAKFNIAASSINKKLDNKNTRNLPLNSLSGMVDGLLKWVSKLQPKQGYHSTWSNYTNTRNYTGNGIDQKLQLVEQYVKSKNIASLIDLGCNTGEFSEVALTSGATHVIAYDFDHEALELAYLRSKEKNLNMLPLYMDITNPSPNQGWMQSERVGMNERMRFDGLIALALIHHIVISRNIPLDQFVRWIFSIAPSGLLEFVPKEDPMVEILLKNREDIFPDYNLENLRIIVKKYAEITAVAQIKNSNRTVIEYRVSNL